MLHWRNGRPGRQIIPGNPTGCLIYLSEGADWHQARYQLGHEVTHSVLLPNHTAFEWVQEMFAEHVSIRALIELGEQEYAEIAFAQLCQEAQAVTLTTEQMLAADLETNEPEGIYPKTFLVGLELIEAVSWEQLKPLARTFDAQGKHDVRAWLDSLDPEDQAAASRVLSSCEPDQVPRRLF